jgi:carbamate kinase
MEFDRPGRVLVALGGNAIAGGGGAAGPEDQQAAVAAAMNQVAELVEHGWEVVLTHGNGPQVGNLLLKNQLARGVVPQVPLDWCVAQTQGTIGYMMVTTLERALQERGIPRTVTAVMTRVLVDADDPGWATPTKPIGRFADEAEAQRGMAVGEHWQQFGDRGWRRLVASPEPREILDRDVVVELIGCGVVVVAAGGGGIPMVRDGERSPLRGVEAVLDKDLSGALLAAQVGAESFVIATDVAAAAVRFGSPEQRWLGRVGVSELESLAAAGEFASGSMGPKVEAAVRFVRSGGRRSAITSLEHVVAAANGTAGTVVEAEPRVA